jgi:hypothetical protein
MKLGLHKRQTIFDYIFDNMGVKLSKIPRRYLASEYELNTGLDRKRVVFCNEISNGIKRAVN